MAATVETFRILDDDSFNAHYPYYQLDTDNNNPRLIDKGDSKFVKFPFRLAFWH